jgi:predicted enzyme related to lactoylglutathione lyase
LPRGCNRRRCPRHFLRSERYVRFENDWSLIAGQGKRGQQETVADGREADPEEGLIEAVQAIGGKFLAERQPVSEVTVIDFEDPEGNEFAIEIFS